MSKYDKRSSSRSGSFNRSSSDSDLSLPPNFQMKEEWEEYYGLIPPEGVFVKLPYNDLEKDIYFSTSASESSVSSHALSAPEESGEEKEEEEIRVRIGEEEEEKFFKRKKYRLKHGRQKILDEDEQKEFDNEYEDKFGRPATDGYISYIVNRDGKIITFKEERKKKEKIKRRRIARVRAELSSKEWSYVQENFTEHPNVYIKNCQKDYQDELLRLLRHKEHLTSVENVIKNSLNINANSLSD